MTDDSPTHCECGTPLATHPPLPKPRPLTSWKAAKENLHPERNHVRGGPALRIKQQQPSARRSVSYIPSGYDR